MKNATKGKFIKTAAVGVDVAVPLLATLSQFPVWVQHSSEATMSGLFLFFAALSCIPFLKQIKEFIKSPSAWLVWVILFVVFTALRNIIDQMVIIAFAGMVSNIIGMGIYKLGSYIGEKPDKEGKETENG